MTILASCHVSYVPSCNPSGCERWYVSGNIHRWSSHVSFVNAKGATNENRYRVHNRGGRIGVLPVIVLGIKARHESARGFVADLVSWLGSSPSIALGGKEIFEGGRTR